MLPKWILIPIILILVTVPVVVISGGKRYSNYYLSPLAILPNLIIGLKSNCFLCTLVR